MFPSALLPDSEAAISSAKGRKVRKTRVYSGKMMRSGEFSSTALVIRSLMVCLNPGKDAYVDVETSNWIPAMDKPSLSSFSVEYTVEEILNK
jgi:hypothetical protein